MRSLLFALCGTLLAFAAYAATADSTIQLNPIVQYLGPAASTAITGIVAFVLGYIGLIVKRYATRLGITITDQMWAVVQRTAEHWVAQWWAEEEAWLATVTIKSTDSRIAYWANLAIADIPQVAKELSLTPQKMQEYVAAALGKLQNKAMSINVPAEPARDVQK